MFTEDPIPLRDLISKIYNSKKYIGFKKKMGLKLCSEITCPHIHVTQKFLLPFEKYIDYVCNELLNDFKWSPDLRDHLREICSYLQIKYQMPSDSIYHRWLSPSDEIEMSLHLFPVLQYSTMQSWRKIKGQFIKIQKEVL